MLKISCISQHQKNYKFYNNIQKLLVDCFQVGIGINIATFVLVLLNILFDLILHILILFGSILFVNFWKEVGKYKRKV